MPGSSPAKPVDCTIDFDASHLVGKTAVVTGGPNQTPKKPNLDIIDVNLNGALYTSKLAMHYFMTQNGTSPNSSQTDTCLILIGSGAAYLDCPRGPQYSASKYAMRGIMHSLRRTAYYYGSRINMISPWYVRTKILTDDDFDAVEKAGVQLATTEDAGHKKVGTEGYIDLDLDEYPGNDLLEEIQADQVKFAPVEAGLFV
ncbi:unnamed protein product [Alternaria alternata]